MTSRARGLIAAHLDGTKKPPKPERKRGGYGSSTTPATKLKPPAQGVKRSGHPSGNTPVSEFKPPTPGMHINITNHPRGSTQPLDEVVREAFGASSTGSCRCGPDCPCRKGT